jgi:hypothetical protein
MAVLETTAWNTRAATLVVAASDASSEMKAGADYVGNGTADDVQIQAAIDALPSSGGKVVLSEGTFTLAATIDAVDDMILEGQGFATKLTLAAGSPGAQINAIDIDTVDNVEVCRLQIDGNKGNIDDKSDTSLQHGILSDTAVNCRLHDLWIHDCWEQGIFSRNGADGFQIWAVHSHDNESNGIGGFDCEDHQVWGCFCYDNNVGSGIDYDNCQGCTIGPVVCTGNEYHGINIFTTGTSNETEDMKIVSPTCKSNGQQGIYVDGPCKRVTVLDPTCRSNTLNGIRFENEADNCKLLGGLFEGNTEHGIHAKGNCDDGSIVGATSLNNGFVAIQIEGSTCNNWLIEGNHVAGGSPVIDDQGTNTTLRNNPGFTASGDVVTITKVIDHADIVDGGGASGHADFAETIPAGSIIKAVKLDFTEAFNSDDTTTLKVKVGPQADDDDFSKTATPGDEAFNTTTDDFWGESACQDPVVVSAAAPRVTFTEDNDITHIISGGNAAGGVTITITYMKA